MVHLKSVLTMILSEIIFLSPHAYERMNAALLPGKDGAGAHHEHVEARRPHSPVKVRSIRRRLRRALLGALRASTYLRALR